MVWREQSNHTNDCYFCQSNIKGLKAKNRAKGSYPDVPSALKPAPHSGERFHQDISTIEKRYQGKFSPNMMGDYCCSLHREEDSEENKRKSKVRKHKFVFFM